INADALPLLVKKCININYASYNLVQVIELTQNDETSYIATFDNDRIKFDVQLYNNGEHNVIKKEKKNFIAGL
ncbi:MAG TPA: hypothetical protein VHL77_08975, partial [Ferruginibacter sp.]|nr:hypothetical protein [Ferruginibacter sp.]